MAKRALQEVGRMVCMVCLGMGSITIGYADITCQNCNGRGTLVDIDCLGEDYELPATDAEWEQA